MQIQAKVVMKSQIVMEVRLKVDNDEDEINDGYILNTEHEIDPNQSFESIIWFR